MEGVAEYIYPTVDPRSRFASTRFVFSNAAMRLRPGMYVTLLYQADLGAGIVLPRDAVIRTGGSALAFVQKEGGRYEPRALDLGPSTDDGYVVYDGIEEGDEVVSQAAFFIDSESSLKAALAKFTQGQVPPTHDHQ